MPVEADAPWHGAEHGYVGWVPNVRSHLSFSLIASARSLEALTRAYPGQPARLVLAYEERISHDLPWSARRIRTDRPDLVHQWVLVGRTKATKLPLLGNLGKIADIDQRDAIPAETDRQGMLRGQVHILPYQQEHDAAETQATAVREVRQLIDRPSSMDRDPLPDLDEARNLDELVEAVQDQLDLCANRVQLEFALMRTGELRLWYSEGAPPLAAKRLFQIAEQAYFFVKDAVHDHTHHDPSSDQITPLTIVGRERRELGHGSEIAWRRETLWSLSREIERLQRKGGLVSLRQSLGVIAYAEAFQTYLMGHERCEEEPRRFRPATRVHEYDFKHLKDSVKASIDVAAAKQSQQVQLIIAGGGTFISTASLATSLLNAHNGIARSWNEPFAHYVGMGVPDGAPAFLVENPLVAGILAATILLLPITFVLADGEGGLFNAPQRILSQLARAASVSLAKTDVGAFWWDLTLHVLMVIASLAIVAMLIVGLVIL